MKGFKGIVLLSALALLAMPVGKVQANTQDDILALQSAVTALQTTVAAQQTTIADLQTQLNNNAAFQIGTLGYIKLDTNERNGVVGPHVIFEGVNLHVQNGAGNTFERGSIGDNPPNGLGNLILGYNAIDTDERYFLQPGDRTGSHNLVIGFGNKFPGIFGLVQGWNNTVSGEYPAAIGGDINKAGGWSVVIGGWRNIAADDQASVVIGGTNNQANGQGSVISGGAGNIANARTVSITGGEGNVASGTSSTINGGQNNSITETGNWSSITGGHDNIVSGATSTVSGGIQVEVINDNTYVDGD